MDTNRFPIFSKRFRDLRGSRTQAEFADDIGISRPTVGYYENGTRVPDALILRQIAEKCKVTTDYLVGITDAAEADNRDISIQTGLSDESIQTLQYVTKRFNSRIAVNEILKNPEIIVKLVNYLCAFLEDERKNSRFRGVPLKRNLGDNYADANLVRLIEFLPLWKKDTIERIKNDKGLLDKMLVQYVANLADEEKCYWYVSPCPTQEEIKREHQELEEYMRQQDTDDYMIFIGTPEKRTKDVNIEEQERVRDNAILEILSEINRRYNERMGGDGNNPETR